MLEEVKQFVDECFEGKKAHFERTVYWLKQLKPDADEAMQIAAYAHDIERAFSRQPMEFWKDRELNDPEHLKEHQEKGARRISGFLRKRGYPEDNIRRVAEMVRLHETGGTPEADLIKDADSISYFEVNAPKHVEKFGKPLGKAKVRAKYGFMFSRITSPKARKIAEPLYRKAVDMLESARL